MFSPDGHYVLTMQNDGNLVEYDNETGQAIWASNTANEYAIEAILQTDGNLVVYGTPNPDGSLVPLWASRDRRQSRRDPPRAGRRQHRDLPGEHTALGDQHLGLSAGSLRGVRPGLCGVRLSFKLT